MNLVVCDLMRMFQVSEKTVYRWIKEKKLPAHKVHDQYRFNRSAILKGILFLGAGNLLHVTHTRAIDRMGGLLKIMPVTGGLLIGAASDLREVADLFFSASSVLARLEHTGVVIPETAKTLGLVGPAARASNLTHDVRHDYPTGAYRFRSIPPVRLASGDVYARARIRSLESKRSCEFILEQLDSLASEKILVSCGTLQPHSLAISLIEGWRGEIAHIAMTDEQGEIVRYKIVDPSFHNWAALTVAMRDGQISDFPLCNKSFNLSYAGHDL